MNVSFSGGASGHSFEAVAKDSLPNYSTASVRQQMLFLGKSSNGESVM